MFGTLTPERVEARTFPLVRVDLGVFMGAGPLCWRGQDARALEDPYAVGLRQGWAVLADRDDDLVNDEISYLCGGISPWLEG